MDFATGQVKSVLKLTDRKVKYFEGNSNNIQFFSGLVEMTFFGQHLLATACLNGILQNQVSLHSV